MFFRGIRFAKDFMVKYLNYIFLASKKGQLTFTDGTVQIKFSEKLNETPISSIYHGVPTALKADSWDARSIPCVLIGDVTGQFEYKSITKDLIDAPLVTEEQVRTVGGDIKLNMNLSVLATTTEERDNISDIVCVYLSHPMAKDFFMKHYIVLPEAPRIGGEEKLAQPPTDYPIYKRNLSIPLICVWRETSGEDALLEDIIADVTSYITP